MYFSSLSDQEWEFNATSLGTYSVTAYFVAGSNGREIATESFKVVGIASAIKKAVPDVSSTCHKVGQVTLEWNNVIGGKKVTGAKIYRAAKKNGKYKLVKTVAKAKYVDKMAKNKNFFYKVRLFVKEGKKTYKNKFSEIQCLYIAKPPVPKIKSVTKTADGVVVKWKGFANYGSFKIMRSTKKVGGYKDVGGVWKHDDDGKYESSGTILEDGTYIAGPVTSSPTFLDTSVKSGKTYYYKVRVYCFVPAAIYSTSEP